MNLPDAAIHTDFSIGPTMYNQQGSVNVAVEHSLDPRLEILFALRTSLLKALKRSGDTHTVQDVANAILSGRAQLWGNEQGACVSEIMTYPQRRILNVWLTFGELSACLECEDAMKAFALANGCTALIATGRTGWKLALEERGWRVFGLVMARELT